MDALKKSLSTPRAKRVLLSAFGLGLVTEAIDWPRLRWALSEAADETVEEYKTCYRVMKRFVFGERAEDKQGERAEEKQED